MNPELMNFIEWLHRRNIHFSVISSFRTQEQNDACYGSRNSQHLTGDVVDLQPLSLSVDAFISEIKNSSFKFKLIRFRNFVHISFARARKPRQMELNFTDRK